MASKKIDDATRFMPLRDAACLIGARFPDWQDGDIDQLLLPRSNATDLEAWDRADHAQTQLSTWITNCIIPTYGVDEDGRKSMIEPRWLTTPYFEINVLSGRFPVFPDLWDPIFVDGAALREKLDGVRSLKPRRTQTYEWLPIVNEAWKIALALEPPRTQAAIVGDLIQWHMDGPGEGEAYPDPKELAALARTIVTYLGDKRLIGEVFSSETSADGGANTR